MPSRVAALPRLKPTLRRIVATAGYQFVPLMPPDLTGPVQRVIKAVGKYTLTSPERLAATCDAVQYVSRNAIPGAVVECGVWRGGSMMAAAMTLLDEQDRDRDLYLFDTFEGMTAPTEHDVDVSGIGADQQMRDVARSHDNIWCAASLEDVRRNVSSVPYPSDRVHFVKGPVEDTVPAHAPDAIAVLRLDTDWYESTRHELEHLVPRISPGGVLLIDDYGHWQGARKAVDEWLADFDRPVLLCRVDYTGRIAIIV